MRKSRKYGESVAPNLPSMLYDPLSLRRRSTAILRRGALVITPPKMAPITALKMVHQWSMISLVLSENLYFFSDGNADESRNHELPSLKRHRDAKRSNVRQAAIRQGGDPSHIDS
jgi:hypothetical protein